MKKYEYKIQPVDFKLHSIASFDQDESVLNMLGREGWELVTIIGPFEIAKTPQLLYFLKRQISLGAT